MKTKFIEATNSDAGGGNWGKFLLGRFEPSEWARLSGIGLPVSLLQQRGWTLEHLLVLDIETGEGAVFRPGGLARYDLGKHRVWVCPLFEPFLEWLYQQNLSDLDALPSVVQINDPNTTLAGYRRPRPEPTQQPIP